MINKKTEKRELRGYKILPSVYNKAMKKAKKDGMPLATFIELVVYHYSNGVDITFIDKK